MFESAPSARWLVRAVTSRTILAMSGRSAIWMTIGIAVAICPFLRAQPGEMRAVIPKRIVAMAPNSAEVICSLGACDRIVGVSKFCIYPEELKKRPKVGGLSDPDLELITALRPDLLVLRGRNDALERLADTLKIPIYRDETDTLAGIEQCLRELGEKLGLSKEGEAKAQEFRDRIRAVRHRVADLPKPRVLVTVSRQPDRLANILTTGRGTFLDEMIDTAGGVNVFGQLDMPYPQVSPEAILAQQPEVILELLPDVELTQAVTWGMLTQWKNLGSIPAVTMKRICFINDDNCLIPSPRYAEVIEEIAALLHPEKAREP